YQETVAQPPGVVARIVILMNCETFVIGGCHGLQLSWRVQLSRFHEHHNSPSQGDNREPRLLVPPRACSRLPLAAIARRQETLIDCVPPNMQRVHSATPPRSG